MAWSTPRVWAVGELVTAANMNTYLSNNLSYLFSAVSAEIELVGANLTPSNTSGCAGLLRVEMATNKEYLATMQFANSVKTYAEMTLPAWPDDYNGGTVTARFIWTANSTSGNSVVWGFQGVAYADNDAIDAAFGTAQEVTDANGTSVYTRRLSTPTAAITLAGTPAAGKSSQLRVYRLGSGSDNLAVTALLIGILINYTRS